jgi:hypothetical protein
LINDLPDTLTGLPADAPPAPLDPGERSAAAQIARRLAVELRGVVSLLPKDDRTASAMSRALQVDRNTCQRLVASLGSDDLNESLLVKLPGVLGLRQLIEAISKRCREPSALEQLAAATAAVDALQVLIDRVAGSQRRLRHRLEADIDFGSTPRGPSDDSHARRALFRAAAELVGRWSDVMTTMSIIRPHPSDPGLTDTARVQGRIGHMWRASAVPLEIGASTPGVIALDPVKTDDNAPMQTLHSRPARGDTPDSLLREFCSDPPPRVTSRAHGKQTIHVIDPSEPASTRPVDIFVGHRRSTPDRHPATIDPPVGEISSLIVYPSRRLLADVFLHRDVARHCTQSTELHLGGFPAGATGHRARWSTRFPGGPRLELLGSGLARTGTSAYSRYTELTANVFDRLGWDPAQFIGYRIDVAYPIWQAAYCVLFDFGPGGAAS